MEIKAEKRDVAGKNVRHLRRQSLLPAVVYGPSSGSINITVNPKDFAKIFKNVGYSKLFDLELGKEKLKVLVKDTQKNIITDEFIHVDFYQVDMKKEITAEIPLEFLGESFAAKNNIGLLVHSLNSVEVTCLPSDLPSKLTVSLDELKEIGDSITIKDINLPKGVEFASGASVDVPVVYVAAPQKTVEEEASEVSETEAEAGDEEKAEDSSES